MPPPEGPAVGLEEEEEPQWDEKVLRGLLRGEGRMVHAAIGVAEQDWIYTRDDLDELLPPLTRLCNRYIPHLAKYADPAVIAAVLMSYATRSLTERRDALIAAAGDPGTRPIPPAGEQDEEAPQPPEAPPPPAPESETAPAPRAAGSFPSSAERPTPQEVDPANAPPAPQPVEGVDPADPEIKWEL